MPVEIKELVIKAVVDDQMKQEEDKKKTSSGIDREMIIEDCVEQVMEIIKRENER